MPHPILYPDAEAMILRKKQNKLEMLEQAEDDSGAGPSSIRKSKLVLVELPIVLNEMQGSNIICN
jgi:hypothetical protein